MKLTLVRVLGFSNTRATDLPPRAPAPSPDVRPRLSSAASCRIDPKSAGVSSAKVRKSLPSNADQPVRGALNLLLQQGLKEYLRIEGLEIVVPLPHAQEQDRFAGRIDD